MDIDYEQNSLSHFPEIVCKKRLWCTKLSQAYEGTFGLDSIKVLIVKSNRVIPLEDRQEEDSRLKQIIDSLPRLFAELEPLFAGVSVDGFSYLVFTWIETTPLDYLKMSFAERMSIYIKCLQIIEDLSNLGFAFDDISIDAFRKSSNGDILYFAMLSSNKFQVTTVGITGGLVKVFCSPEEIIGGQISVRSSIFSLGILGYFLLSARDPSKMPPTGVNNFLKENMPPSQMAADVKSWVDNVVGNCLFVNSDQRLASVKEIINYLEEGITNGKTSLESVRWQQQGKLKQDPRELVKIEPNQVVSDSVVSLKKRVAKSNRRKIAFFERLDKITTFKFFLPLLGFVAVLLSVSLVIFVFSSLTFVGNALHDLHPRLVDFKKLNSSLQIENELLVLDKVDNSIEDRRHALNELAGASLESDLLLLRYCKEKSLSSEFSLDYLSILSNNLNKLTLGKVGQYLNSYFANAPKEVCAQGDLLLDLFNPKSVLVNRLKALRLLFAINSNHGIMLAAYLSNGANGAESNLFFSELKKYFSVRGYNKFPDNLTFKHLVLLDHKLAEVVGEKPDQIIKDMSLEDIKLTLKVIFDSHQRNPPSLDSLLTRYKSEQQLVKPIDKLFEIAKSIEGSDSRMSHLIMLLGMGSLSAFDVVNLLEWSDARYEEVIYWGLSVGQSEATTLALLDVLNAKGYRNKRGKILFSWLKDNFWSSRAKYSSFISQIILRESYSDEEVEKAFNGLMPVSHHGLFDALVELGERIFLLEAIGRLGMIVDSPKLSTFLRHDDKAVRIVAVEALALRNDLQSLQIILKGFRSEKDKEVKEIYNKSHWVTRDREIPKNIQN